MPGQAAYGAAKAALRSFARTLAAELLPLEIRVNAVTPGPINTPILDKVFPDKNAVAQIREKMIGMVPMRRWGMSEEIAKAVLSSRSMRPSLPAPNFRSTADGLKSKALMMNGLTPPSKGAPAQPNQ